MDTYVFQSKSQNYFISQLDDILAFVLSKDYNSQANFWCGFHKIILEIFDETLQDFFPQKVSVLKVVIYL